MKLWIITICSIVIYSGGIVMHYGQSVNQSELAFMGTLVGIGGLLVALMAADL